MGFYGNITNTTRTQFSFDATYPSRYEMDTQVANDGVYVGRYVLVEYDKDIKGSLSGIPQVYKITTDGLNKDFALSISADFIVGEKEDGEGNTVNPTIIRCITEQDRKDIADGKLKYTDNLIEQGTVLRVPGELNDDGKPIYNLVANSGTHKDPKDSLSDEYWVATGNEQFVITMMAEDEQGRPVKQYTTFTGALWESLGDSSQDSFTLNFTRDKQYYKTSRGYDSTVWQKVLDKGYEKYVMVAELNTIVPTFDITADAPTIVPLRPHFDVDSTNVYYKLHWQPTWGLRIRSSEPDTQVPQYDTEGKPIAATILSSNSRVEYPSDENTHWTRTEFDKTTNSKKVLYAQYNETGGIDWVEKAPENDPPVLNAAIYYNRDGFDPDKVSKSWDRKYLHQLGLGGRRDPAVDPDVSPSEDKGFVAEGITIAPTGLSGNTYANHNGVATPEVDTQELSIMLPSIGDAISDVWDLVYGGRKTNEAIQKTQKRNPDVEWYDARAVQDRTGLRLVKDGFTYKMKSGKTQDCPRNYYNTANVNTIAGCINSVHDLMGMIIQPYNTFDAMKENITNNDDDTIYFDVSNDKYYRRDMKYTYTPLAASAYTYERIDLSEGEFKPDLYYVKNGSRYDVASGKYNKDLEYYVRKLTASEGYEQVKVQPFDGSKYYYINELTNGGKDFISEPIYHRDKTYYTMDSTRIDKTRIDLGDDFTGYTYYQYMTDTSTNKLNSPYYAIDWTYAGQNYDPKATYYDIKEKFALKDVISEPPYTDLYLPGIFYYRAWAEDKYSKVYWDGLQHITVYNKNDDGTYTPVQGEPTVGEYYYQKLHTAGEPYILKVGEQPVKADFDYRIDNSDLGTGNVKEGGVLIDHYMVKKGEKVTETYTEIDTYEQVKFNDPSSSYVWDEAKAGPAWVFDKSVGDYVRNTLPFDPEKNKQNLYFVQQKKYVYVYAGGTIDEDKPLHLLPYARDSVSYRDPLSGDTVDDFHINYKDIQHGNPWFVKTTVNSHLLGPYTIYIPVTATSIRRQLVDYYTNPARDEKDRLQYYQLEKKKIDKFYAPNLYYYKVGENLDRERKGSYILETNKHLKVNNADGYSLAHLTITSADYHKINEHDTATNQRIYFYYPNYFYRKEGDEYVLAQEKTMNPNETYYVIKNFYIDSDTMNIMPHGQQWNNKIKHIPPSVSLATRDVGFTYYELVDFARKLNTIHGLILKMNQVIDSEDTDTRDLKTIQGALNTFNDWISHLGKLDSQDIVIVDNYGRLTSAPANVTQTDEGVNHTPGTKHDVTGIASDVFPMAENLTADGGFKNQWLTVNVDGKPTKPIVSLRHNYQPVRDTTSNSDMNNPKKDTMILYTPIVDPKGHVVGHNDHTVTLPYGFKTITTNGRSGTASGDNTGNPSTSSVVADNTQDTLGINSGNKWIRIDTNASADTITISHDIHTPTVSAKSQTDLNNPATDSITIQDTTYDNAGHMTANQDHKYILPYGFKYITTNGRVSNNNTENLAAQGQIAADNTQDTLGINSGDEWIRIVTNPDSDVLTISHDVKNTSSVDGGNISLSNEENGTTFSITLYDFDSKNHFSKKTTTKYTLPNSYGKIAADVGTTTEASCTHDTFTLSGDSWIKTTVSKDKVSFTHQAPQTSNLSSTVEDTNKTPALGGTFSIPKISYDSKGHVSSKTSYTITLPSLSLSGTKGSTDNVMTNLTYSKNGDTFTATFGKIGDLALTGYSTPTSITTDIAPTDSLNIGLGKLRYYITKEVEDRGSAITKEVTDRNNAITAAIDDLDYTDLESDEKYVSRVDESAGVINVTHKNFPVATVDKKGLVQVVTDQNAAERYEDYQVPCMELIDDLWGQLDSLTSITNSINYKAMVKNASTGEITQEDKQITFIEFVNRISLIEKLLVNTTNKTLDDPSLATS
jgi:hypothetical protein